MTQPYALFLADILEDACKPADVAEKAALELRRLHALIAACEPYLKEEETPVERMERDHRDSLALMTLLAREKTKNEMLLEVVNKLEYSFDGYIKRYPEEAEVRAAITKCEGNT